MSKTWFIFAEKLRSCRPSAIHTSSPYMKVRCYKLVLVAGFVMRVVVCLSKVNFVSEPHAEWNVTPGTWCASISLCLRSRVWSRKSLCWRPMLGYISIDRLVPSQHCRIMCRGSCLPVLLTHDEMVIVVCFSILECVYMTVITGFCL